jgi:hypothetical protein
MSLTAFEVRGLRSEAAESRQSGRLLLTGPGEI